MGQEIHPQKHKKRATLLCFMSLHQSLFITLKMKLFAYSSYRVPQFDQTLHSVEMFSFCSTCYYSSQCPQQTPETCIKNEGRSYREGRIKKIKKTQNFKFCSHNKSKCVSQFHRFYLSAKQTNRLFSLNFASATLTPTPKTTKCCILPDLSPH